MRPAAAAEWIVSRRTGWRGFWGLVGVLVFGAAAFAAVLGFVQAPHVDSGVLVLIALPFLVMAVVLAVEGLGQGLVRLDDAGYSALLGRQRAWSDVLAVGTGLVEGARVPVVAVRGEGGVPEQDVFTGFADPDADALVDALRARVVPMGFGSLDLSPDYWAEVESEADRAASVVRETAGREPWERERVEFGYPGLASAIRLDYGTNEAGERVELLVRKGTVLAVSASGRRWLRQQRKRTPDAADEVRWLFEPHVSEVLPGRAGGFDRLEVTPQGRRPLVFNAEEPDRF